MIDPARLVEQVAKAICNADEIPDWRCGHECRLAIDGMAPCDHAAGAKAAVALVLRAVAEKCDKKADDAQTASSWAGLDAFARDLETAAAEVEGGK